MQNSKACTQRAEAPWYHGTKIGETPVICAKRQTAEQRPTNTRVTGQCRIPPPKSLLESYLEGGPYTQNNQQHAVTSGRSYETPTNVNQNRSKLQQSTLQAVAACEVFTLATNGNNTLA
eukprot:5597271-Pyramimonas_sp.AAC.1